MNTKHATLPRRSRLGQALVAALLVVLYMGQPALATVAQRYSDHSCKTTTDPCCCAGSSNVYTAPDSPAGSCCSNAGDDTLAPDGPATGNCSCRTESTPFSAPDPVLPSRGSQGAGDGSLATWVRAHAQFFASLPSGPSRFYRPPRTDDGLAGPARVSGVDESPLAQRVSSASGWALLMRGVPGLLALLSIARI